jgi:hypothetical protein
MILLIYLHLISLPLKLLSDSGLHLVLHAVELGVAIASVPLLQMVALGSATVNLHPLSALVHLIHASFACEL